MGALLSLELSGNFGMALDARCVLVAMHWIVTKAALVFEFRMGLKTAKSHPRLNHGGHRARAEICPAAHPKHDAKPDQEYGCEKDSQPRKKGRAPLALSFQIKPISMIEQ